MRESQTMDPMNAETMHCPTCRAVQAWSNTCRRCKSDLQLLRQVAEECTAVRRECLFNLRHNRTDAALELARHCFALNDDVDSRRLLAVCELLNANWTLARAHAIKILKSN
jgi:hypothetical protein